MSALFLKYKIFQLLTVAALLASLRSISQTNRYEQFWNEFAFTRSLKGKWVSELDFGQTWSSSPDNNNPFYVNSQLYVRGWIHCYATSRWKFSGFLSYYYNRAVPELSQHKLPELRIAVQGIYYFHKVGYTLQARLRIEDRKIRNDEEVWEASYRFRTQVKLVKPINSKNIRKGVVYAICSDELFFKTGALITGGQFFDRNRLTLGGGYSITDDLQIELTYVNDYLPRSEANEVVNAFQINVNFNNFLSNLKKRISAKNETPDHD